MTDLQYQLEIKHLQRVVELKDETIEVLEDTIKILKQALEAK